MRGERRESERKRGIRDFTYEMCPRPKKNIFN
jgi:hypothetical protein